MSSEGGSIRMAKELLRATRNSFAAELERLRAQQRGSAPTVYFYELGAAVGRWSKAS